MIWAKFSECKSLGSLTNALGLVSLTCNPLSQCTVQCRRRLRLLSSEFKHVQMQFGSFLAILIPIGNLDNRFSYTVLSIFHRDKE
jgi:hypothetical protein